MAMTSGTGSQGGGNARPTMADIAKELGVAKITVSRALSSHSTVKDSTRKLIRETAERMGYRLNISARNLRQQRTRTIAVVIEMAPSHDRLMSEPYPLSLLGGLPTDGDEHHAIDNTFLAVPLNKGIIGAILVAAVFLLLLWRLAKKHRATEVICLVALTLYLFMENKPFLVSANPFLLMLPVVFFGSPDSKNQTE